MRGDIHPAAYRLLTQLPVRTHTAPEPPPPYITMARRKPMPNPGGKFRVAKPVRVRGREFPSICAATRCLHVSLQTLYKWLNEGKAEYL